MARAKSPDAITLLKTDHKTVSALFTRYEKARGDASKLKIARTICAELTMHAAIEEEIFYAAARQEVPDVEENLDEAEVEHGSLKTLIAQIDTSSPADPLFDAKVKVLGEYVKHHVKEEEREMMPKVRKSDLDLRVLGEEMAARKRELKRMGGAAKRPDAQRAALTNGRGRGAARDSMR